MNILILEDNRYIIKSFKSNLIGNYVCVFDQIPDFEYTYKRKDMKWDIVFLDYDLDESGNYDFEKNNGMKAVECIVEHKKDALYVIHSANDTVAPMMLSALRKAGLKSIRYYGCWQNDCLIKDLETIFDSKELSNHDVKDRLPAINFCVSHQIFGEFGTSGA